MTSFLSTWRRVVLLTLTAATAATAQVPGDPGVDPPTRVARVNLVEGSMSFSSGPDDDWSAALLNRPLIAGDRLWTAARSRAEVQVGASTARLGSETALNLVTLDDQSTQVQLSQGTVNLRVRDLGDGQRVQVDTPNLSFVAAQPGEYRFDVDPSRNGTRVSVLSGSGSAYGERGVAYPLSPGQQVTFGGSALAVLATQTVPPRDAFDTWVAQRDRAEEQSISARYVSREIPGYQQLDQYGDWSTDPAYGAVWYPRAVAADWAPYSTGQWSYIAPWGWTWVDVAPWGFAPFHYGRWAYVGTRWAWVPGPVARQPVYAPALVGFVGGSNVSLTVSSGRPAVGWFPLAPGEVWQPGFRASPRYVSRVNEYHFGRPDRDDRRDPGYRYQRVPQAVTAVSADAFVQGRPVREDRYRFRADELERSRVAPGPGFAPAPGAVPDRRFFGGTPAGRPTVVGTPPVHAVPGQTDLRRPQEDRPGFAFPGGPARGPNNGQTQPAVPLMGGPMPVQPALQAPPPQPTRDPRIAAEQRAAREQAQRDAQAQQQLQQQQAQQQARQQQMEQQRAQFQREQAQREQSQQQEQMRQMQQQRELEQRQQAQRDQFQRERAAREQQQQAAMQAQAQAQARVQAQPQQAVPIGERPSRMGYRGPQEGQNPGKGPGGPQRGDDDRGRRP